MRDTDGATQITAKDVAELRARTGAGMMDCKKALEEAAGDMEVAIDLLRKRGIAKADKRADRAASQGVVSLVIEGNVGAIVELKSETDFVAGWTSSRPRPMPSRYQLPPPRVSTPSANAPPSWKRLKKVTLKENIGLGDIKRIEAADGNAIGSYQHIQGGRGVNGVLVEVAGGTPGTAHDIAVHITSSRVRRT